MTPKRIRPLLCVIRRPTSEFIPSINRSMKQITFRTRDCRCRWERPGRVQSAKMRSAGVVRRCGAGGSR